MHLKKSWRTFAASLVGASLLVVASLSIAGAQQTAAGARATSPAKAYAPSGSVKLVNHGVVDLRKLLAIKAGAQTPTQSRPARDLKTPQQRAAYEAAVRNGSIKLPSATQTLTVKSAAQSPSFVGGGTNPLLVKYFDGLNSAQSACGGNGACPPDQAIATDLSYVMEGVNTSIGIYNANTGALQYGPYSADNFFAPVKKAGDIFLSPQMNYDVMRDRWVVLFAEEKPDHSASYLDLAVS